MGGDAQTCGIVTLLNWTMMPNGQTYLYLWAERMAVLTDAQIAKTVPGFRSAEHWSLAMLNKAGETVTLLPGCQVKAWVYCTKPPDAPGCFDVSKL